MEVQELKDILEGYRPSIVVSGKEIDKNDENVQAFIELYYKLTGKRVGEGSCRNCIFDAYMELSIKTDKQLKRLIMPSKYKMREGRVVVFNNTDYTNANMTDEVALQMVAFNVKHAGNFLNPEELLKEHASKSSSKAKKKVAVIEKLDERGDVNNIYPEKLLEKSIEDNGNKVVSIDGETPKIEFSKPPLDEISAAMSQVVEYDGMTLDDLKVLYKEKTGKNPHYKWDYDRIMEKLNED